MSLTYMHWMLKLSLADCNVLNAQQLQLIMEIKLAVKIYG